MKIDRPVERVNNEIKINITRKQKDFIDSKCDEALYGGSVGGGKTYALLLFSAMRRMSIPDSRGIIFRRTYPEIERSVMPESRKIFSYFGAKYNEVKHHWKFPNGSIQELGHCFDRDTEILTENSWKKFSDLLPMEKVATIDNKNRIRMTVPKKHIAYDYNGKMIYVNQRCGVNILVTPEHRFKVKKLNSSGNYRSWSNWKIEKAVDFKGTRKIRRSFSQYTSVGSDFVYFEKVKNGHGNIKKCERLAFSKFLGWFLSEGCLSKQKHDIFIYQKVKLQQLIDDVKKCGFGFNVYYPTDGISVPRVQIHSKELYSWLKSRYGGLAHQKRIPRECFGWPEECLKNLLRGYLLGDGYLNPKKFIKSDEFRCSINTTSKGMADDIQNLCLRIGLTAVIGHNKAGKRIFRGKEYNCREQFPVSISSRKYSTFRNTDIKKVNYSGKVYCVNVEPYHTLVVRRNGRAYMAMNCESEEDVYKYQGGEYLDMCFDESTHFSFFQYNYLKTRLRTVIPGTKTMVRLATNPGGVGHSWILENFIKPSEHQKIWQDPESGKTFTFIQARLTDNPYLMESDPDYAKRMKDLKKSSEKKYMALVEGRWDIYEGIYFAEWNKNLHVTRNIHKPSPHTLKFLSLDWGFAEPACVLWFEVTPLGRVFVYREIYETRKSPKELARMILEMSPESEEYMYMRASPEIWGKKVETENGGEVIKDLMQAELGDRIIMEKANNARVAGWLKCREYLSLAPDGYPWIQISPVCRNLIRTLPAMIHEDRPGRNSEDIRPDSDDHAPDAFRYAITSLKEIPKSPFSPYATDYEKIFGVKEHNQFNRFPTPGIPGNGGYGI